MKKKTESTISIVKVLGLAAAAMLIMASVGRTPAQTEQLPISAFLDLLPNTAFQSWFDPSNGNLLLIDAYGKRNAALNLNLGTTVDGRVTVMDLRDGTQRVTVHLQTRNAICWGFNEAFQPAFGYSPVAVRNNVGPAALGTSITRIVYEPQPVGSIDVNWPIETYMGTVSCQGLLRAGSGFPEGTEGFAQTTQIGIFGTGVPTGCPPERDASCFPAEKVQFKPLGTE
jgi:hypothetical protein